MSELKVRWQFRGGREHPERKQRVRVAVKQSLCCEGVGLGAASTLVPGLVATKRREDRDEARDDDRRRQAQVGVVPVKRGRHGKQTVRLRRPPGLER